MVARSVNKTDSLGNVRAGIGKVSFGAAKLLENLQVFWEALLAAKPRTAKGVYLESAYLASTMGPGIRLTVVQPKTE